MSAKINFLNFPCILAFDIAVLQFVFTGAIGYLSFQFFTPVVHLALIVFFTIQFLV